MIAPTSCAVIGGLGKVETESRRVSGCGKRRPASNCDSYDETGGVGADLDNLVEMTDDQVLRDKRLVNLNIKEVELEVASQIGHLERIL